MPPISVLVLGLLSLPAGPLCEEVAWRAFALRKLQTRFSSLASALYIGTFWAVWHIPMWVLTMGYLAGPLLLIICISLIAWSVVFSFVYNRSGQSLPVVILLHGTYMIVQNEVAAALSFGHSTLQDEVASAPAYGPRFVTVIVAQMVLALSLAVLFWEKVGGSFTRRLPGAPAPCFTAPDKTHSLISSRHGDGREGIRGLPDPQMRGTWGTR